MTRSQTAETVAEFFTKRVPAEWFSGAPEIQVDADEILVVGTLPEGRTAGDFRDETRNARIDIASQAEETFARKVSWGVKVGDETRLFTHLSLPVMSRLRLPERAVLDTLIEAGVARSRSDALAWCVRLVGRHQSDWLQELRDALVEVQKVRAGGPAA